MAGEVTTRLCFCPQRMAAQGSHTFRYSHVLGGWWLSDTPLRTMSARAAYLALHERADEFPHEDHRGEPLVWLDCPFCGGILPRAQADGTP